MLYSHKSNQSCCIKITCTFLLNSCKYVIRLVANFQFNTFTNENVKTKWFSDQKGNSLKNTSKTGKLKENLCAGDVLDGW